MKNFKKGRLLGVVGLSLLLGASVSINADAKAKTKSTSSKNTNTVIPIGDKAPQSVDIVLKPHNTKDLNNYTYAVTKKGNANFHKYLTPDQFASKYGQSSSAVNQITKYMKKYNLKVTTYKGNLVMNVTGSTKNMEKAFHVKIVNKMMDGSRQQVNQDAINLPKSLYSKIMSITGFGKMQSAKAAKAVSSSTVKMPNMGHFSEKTPNSTNTTPQKFINQYNVSPLYKSGKNLGQGKTIGIVSFSNVNTSDAYNFWKQMGIPVKSNRISINRVDGKKGTWDGYQETTLDIEQSGAVAPQANIRVYTSDSFGPTAAFNNIAAANSENKVDVLSMSWGLGEAQIASWQKTKLLPKAYLKVLNLLLQQAAVQGISTFASSGDNGAYQGTSGPISNGLSVNEPSASPYVTSVGGTTLPNTYRVNGKTVEVKKERAWGDDFLYPGIKTLKTPSIIKQGLYLMGGGGGFSKVQGLPAYQKGVSGTQTFRAKQMWDYSKGQLKAAKNYKIVTGTRSGRNLPDVSANSDIQTGYKIYISSPNNGGKGKWQKVGGTSVATPQIAAGSLLIGQSVGSRLGLMNPALYEFAQSSNSPFTTLDSATDNTNLYYTGQPGKLYNQATGLGTIDFTKLNASFQNQ